ncbi:MAG: O-antigen ligase family protein [Bacteroidota bacterium]|nr:O-antigen ligase family protein [Bacteroidota bacterium]
MKEVFCIEDTLINRISYYLSLAFLVALPFDLFYSEMILVCLALHTIIQADWRKPFRIRRSLLLVVAIYAVTMIGTLYTSDLAQAWKDWEKQLALVLFPLIFSMLRLDLGKYKFPLMKAFAFSCLLTSLYLYGDALMTIRFNGVSPRLLFTPPFMSHNFSRPIDLHATYFSMYIAISVATFACLFIRSRSSMGRWFYALASLALLAAMLQLASRAVCIALLIGLATLPFFLVTTRRAWRFVLVALPLSMGLVWAMGRIGGLHERYISGLKEDLSVSAEEPGIVEPRLVRWNCTLDLIRARPLTGYGTGAEIKQLKEVYFDRHLYSSYVHELNAHSEYLSFLLKTGPLGLIVFLTLLGTAVFTALRTRDALFYAFCVIVLCVSFSENILDTNKGIFFFAFFTSFFFTIRPPNPRLEPNPRPAPTTIA